MRQRNEPVRLLGRRLLLVGLLILSVLGSLGVWNTYQKERESAALDREAQAQAQDLSQREAKFETDIAELQTNRGKEEALREQYALAAKGEHVIVIVDQPEQAPTTASSSAFVEWLHKTFPWW
jgi:cell division protein FtsB